MSNICVENLEFGTTVADPGGVDPDPDHTLEKKNPDLDPALEKN